MSALSERPANPVVGEAIPHESAALHVTGAGALHRRPRARAPRTSCTPTRCRRRTPTPGSPGSTPTPALAVPGVVRVLTAADVPGVNDAGVKHDEPLFPDRGHVLRPRGLLGARRDPRGGPARGRGGRGRLRAAAGAGHRRARRSRPESFQGAPAARWSAATSTAGFDAAGPRLQRRVRVRRPGALLPRDPLLRWRTSTRTARSSSRAAPSTPPRPRRSSPTCSGLPQPRGHRAVPADGRRLRRQGDAAARVSPRSPRSARRSPAGRSGCGSTAPRT